jgi:hypothetical protein
MLASILASIFAVNSKHASPKMRSPCVVFPSLGQIGQFYIDLPFYADSDEAAGSNANNKCASHGTPKCLANTFASTPNTLAPHRFIRTVLSDSTHPSAK